MDYLDLNGDLGWLEASTAADDIGERNGLEIDSIDEELDELIQKTTQLGLTLPPAFIKLYRNEHLLVQVPSQGWDTLQLHNLREFGVQRQDGNGEWEEGYVFTLLSNGNTTLHMSLYLDMMGRHAILGSSQPFDYSSDKDDGESVSSHDDIDSDDDEDHQVTDRAGLDTENNNRCESVERAPRREAPALVLNGVDFERWLVEYYFSERISLLVNEEEERTERDDITLDTKRKPRVIPEHIKRHLREVYTMEGRMMQ